MCWCILNDAISINEYSIRPTLYEISTVLIITNKSTIIFKGSKSTKL